MSEQTASYSGWAVVELFGHQREVGLVTTEYFGAACMFRIDVPGNDIVEARTRYVSPGAVYALSPCTEAAAKHLLEHTYQPPAKLALPSEREPDDFNPDGD